MNNVVLFSGGLDSMATILCLQHNEEQVSAIYVDLGTEYANREIEVCRRLADVMGFDLHVIELRSLGALAGSADSGAFLPYRNCVLATVAAAHLDTDGSVWMGGLRDDNVGDKTPEAFESMTAMLKECGPNNITVRSMFWNYSKDEMVREMIVDFRDKFLDLCKVSISCYRGTRCGECPSCFRKCVALYSNGVDCINWFKTNPLESETAKQYSTKILDQKYDESRRVATLTALKQGGAHV